MRRERRRALRLHAVRSVTIMDGSGTVLSSSAYGWVYLFQGGRQDAMTGDYNFQMRDYDPVLGRWTSMDPLGFEAGDPDLYRTEGNNPVGNLDPSGEILFLIPVLALVGGTAWFFGTPSIANAPADTHDPVRLPGFDYGPAIFYGSLVGALATAPVWLPPVAGRLGRILPGKCFPAGTKVAT